MTKILITGVGGLLGSRLADWIINNTNNDVVGIDDFSGGYIENVNKKINFNKFNLTNLDKLYDVFKKEKIEIVYHFAAYAAEGLSPFIRKFNYENNVIASTNLITCSIEYNVKRFVFASSMAVYGDKYEPPFDEELIQSPIDPYGIAKYAVEMDLKLANDFFGLKYNIVRPHNVVGIYQNIWDRYRNVIGIWIRKILNNEPVTIFGDGKQTRSFCYVDDLIEGMFKLMYSDLDTPVNIGNPENYTIIELAKKIRNLINPSLEFKFSPMPQDDPLQRQPNIEKAKKELNWQPKINLDEGIKLTIDWFKKNNFQK